MVRTSLAILLGLAAALLLPAASSPAPARSIDTLAWAPANDIAFSSGSLGGAQGVYAVRPDGTGLRRLSRSGNDPKWSPHRDLIAFTANSSLYVVRPDGTGLRRLRRGVIVLSGWSPDGSRLLFATIDGTLWTVRRDGSNPQLLATTHLDLIEAAWSPDGRQIAFIDCRTPGSSACAHAPAWDVYVLRIGRGSKRRRITRRDIALGHLSWAPARLIAFEGDQGAYVASPGAASERVAIRRATAPSWSPDGRWLAANLSGGPVVARPDGSGRRFLGKFRGASITVPPAWSSDSRRVAFVRPGKIFTARATGGGVQRVL